MATYCGSGGFLWADGLVKNVRSWSITLTASVATGGHSSSSGWLDACLGMKGWTASAEVYDDTADAAAEPFEIGDDVLLELWDLSRSFDGNAFITDVTYNCDVEGGALVSSSASFQGYGALTIAAVAPSGP